MSLYLPYASTDDATINTVACRWVNFIFTNWDLAEVLDGRTESEAFDLLQAQEQHSRKYCPEFDQVCAYLKYAHASNNKAKYLFNQFVDNYLLSMVTKLGVFPGLQTPTKGAKVKE